MTSEKFIGHVDIQEQCGVSDNQACRIGDKMNLKVEGKLLSKLPEITDLLVDDLFHDLEQVSTGLKSSIRVVHFIQCQLVAIRGAE